MNLCELPFATLSERSNGREQLHFESDDFDRELGQTVRRTLTVKGDPEFGLPTEKDEEIYLGLLKYSNDYNGFSHPEVRFSRSALFELLGWPKSDWAYARLTKGMHRLVGVRLSYQNFWRDNRDKQWRNQGAFGILDSFEFRDSRIVGANASYSEQASVFRWGSVLFKSFESDYVKRIDYGLARSLSPTARRLYRYLDKHFFPPHKMTITIDLGKLAYQHIGVSQSVEMNKVRDRHVGPAAEELVAAGFLKASQERFRKIRRGIWEATFDVADSNGKRPDQTDPAAKQLVDALSSRGVSTKGALTLIASHQAAEVVETLRVFDEQTKSGNQIRGADAWFSAALKNGYKPTAAVQRSAKRPELQLFRASRRSR